MDSEKTIENLYQLIKSKHGSNLAKLTIKSIIGNILHDLESEGHPISEQNVSIRLNAYLNDFKQVIHTDVA
jgi:hypothetical protein